MPETNPLQPTLWRTCRVLANRNRLRLFHLLVRQPGQTVSSVATRLDLPLPVASQYLRAMEARGLLTVRRVGRRVAYRLGTDTSSPAHDLVTALRSAFQREPTPAERFFKLATAFTHPRRIEVFRLLKAQPRTLAELHTETGISTRALVRHVSKLEARGYVAAQQGQYAAVKQTDPVARELARLADG